ncbi:MAG: hypothetical protein GQ570_11750 [Helicobacteraceae bacterium]|nr:hypothetical protein [Helicobacteraceae bacterium]
MATDIAQLAISIKTGDILKAQAELKRLELQGKKTETSAKGMTSSFNLMSTSTIALTAGLYGVSAAIKKVATDGIAFNAQMEKSLNSLKTLSAITQDKSIPIMERYSIATDEATKTLAELQKINLKTPHSLIQTNQIYSAMYSSMKLRNVSTVEMIKLTEKLSIVSGAMGVEFNQLLSGVDALASGTYMANSGFGMMIKNLGITKKEIQETDDVYKLLISKVGDVKAFDTWETAISNMNNAWDNFAGALTKDIFKDAKESANELASILNRLTTGWKYFTQDIETTKDIFEFDNVKDLSRQIRKLTGETNLLKEETESWTWKLKDNDAKLAIREHIKNNEKLLTIAKHHRIMLESTNEESISSSNKKIELSKEEIKALERQLELNNQLIDTYYRVTASEFDVWQMDVSNQMAEMALSTSMSNEEMEKYYEALQKTNPLLTEMSDAIERAALTASIELDFKLNTDEIKDGTKDSLKAVDSMYGGMTSLMHEFYDEDDDRKKKQQEIDRTVKVINQAARLAELAQVLTTETSKQSIYGVTALASALTAPWPLNIPAFITVAAMLASIGVAVSGGGGGATPPPEVQGSDVGLSAFGDFGVNTNQSLEDAIEDLASKIEVQNKIYENLGDFGGTFVNALTMGAADLIGSISKEITDFTGRSDGLVEINGLLLQFDIANKTFTNFNNSMSTTFDTTLEMAEGLADISTLFGTERFEWAEGNISDIQSAISIALDEYTLSLIDLYEEMDDYRDDWIEIYEESTGSNKFTQAKLSEAFADIEDLRKQIGSSTITDLYSDLITAYDVDFKELKRVYDNSSQAELIQYMTDTFPTMEFNPENVYEFIDALDLVGEALATSTENINSFIDSFKTEEQLAQDLAKAVGVDLASNTDELVSLFKQLAYDTEGLTDAEYDLLDANKALIDSGLDDYIDGITSSISTLESAFNSMEAVIDRLRGAAIGSSYTLDQFYDSMSETIDLSRTDDYQAFGDSLQDTIAKSNVLMDASAFDSDRNMKFAQLVASNQFESMEETTLEQIDYLKLIEENTRGSAIALEAKITELSTSVSSLSNSTSLSTPSSGAIDTLGLVSNTFEDVLNRTPDTTSEGFKYWESELMNNPNITESNLDESIARGAVGDDVDAALEWLSLNGIKDGLALVSRNLNEGLISNYDANNFVDEYGILNSTVPDNHKNVIPFNDFLNAYSSMITPFAEGGLVKGGMGGVLGLVGEKSHSELIVPLKDDPLNQQEVINTLNAILSKLEQSRVIQDDSKDIQDIHLQKTTLIQESA